MKLSVALRLGRVSNLPTVWTNTLAGIVLAGGEALSPRGLLLFLALSLLYVGGMVLNDAFDREVDARERPERPIPSGEIGAGAAFATGSALLGAALLLLLGLGIGFTGGSGWRAPGAGFLLALLIVLYDWRHKGVRWSPYLMGVCRALVYLTAGLAFVALPPGRLWLAAAALFAYVAGLTAIARGEAHHLAHSPKGTHRPLSPPGHAVAWLIAGIPLLDALLIAGSGAHALAWLAAAACPLTLALQRHVPGT
jgi:4-hydroxybenzoate polyprenyltransferase